jgi:XTP/dITP diphosphohydrolase
MPGIFSARWSGATSDTDSKNLELVLAQISDVAAEHRGAKFVCAAALVLPDGREFVTHGEVLGQILTEPIGTNGFGYDPIFKPTGFDVTTAQMTAEEKDAISHRSRALTALAKEMATALNA